MIDATMQILPLILIFLLGYGLKKAKMLSSDDGSTLLKLMFYAGTPALIFLSVLKVEIDASLIWLCFLAPVVVAVTLAGLFVLRRSLLAHVNVKTFGALLTGAVVMNTSFLMPFVEKLYGAEGLARLAVIDAFNALVLFSLVYVIVVKLGNDKPDRSFIAKKLLIAPAIWALLLAVTFKFCGVTLPVTALDAIGMVAKTVGPVILIALGLKFTMQIKQPRLLVVSLALRFILGAAIGVAFVKVLGLEGLTAEIAIFASIAPIGFSSIVFAELEKLDVEFAVSQVSIALVIGLIATPFIVQLLPHI